MDAQAAPPVTGTLTSGFVGERLVRSPHDVIQGQASVFSRTEPVKIRTPYLI